MCSFEGCERRKVAKGFCMGHWRQQSLQKPLTPLRPLRPRGTSCKFDGCDRPLKALGLCGSHYSQSRKQGTLSPIRERPAVRVNREGYVLIRKLGHPNADSSGRILEHRFVMSEQLGRPLRAGETVHHKNGDRADNRPSNLELWTVRQLPGQRVEDRVAWAIELLMQYGEQFPEQLEKLIKAGETR